MASEPLVPLDRWNLGRVLFGPEELRKTNQQRFEMEQLDAVSHLDPERLEIVGWKDVRDDEFWVRGHVPGRPILPGVLQLESLAQLTSFYIGRTIPDIGFIGFGGVDEVRFRRTVVPGERLVLVGKGVEIRSRRAIFDTQGWVDGKLAVEARITGMRV
ncbi:MAG: 3-hydroxyacyl-[acyl-carrier-protein] dehydratase FabZ [Planctomycetes bacterium]|nr:3-hydroxyacyl-[acyl-carrier-protein] dehydratase FabZ [Planctomycetota bacterium]